MAKESAFGGNSSYGAYKAEGSSIAYDRNRHKLKRWLELLTGDNPVEVQRAAAVCHAASDVDATIFSPYFEQLITVLKKNVHDAGPRFTYRVLAEVPIPEKYQGEIIDLSFKALVDPSNAIAIRVFAMTVIANHLDQYPDLVYEFEAILAEGMPTGSAGFRSRASKIAKKYKLNIS